MPVIWSFSCEGPFGWISEKLQLTETQREQAKSVYLSHTEKMIQLRNLSGEKEAKLRTLSSTQNADMGQINKVIEEIGDLNIRLMKNRASQKQELRKILTDEQRAMFDLHSQRFGKGRWKHRGANGFHHFRNNERRQ